MLVTACSTTSPGSPPQRPDIPIRDTLRQACANPERPELTPGLIQAAEAGDLDAAAAARLAAEVRLVLGYSVELAGVVNCERARRAELVALVDAANR